jgi:hypothetical protein
MDVKTQISFMHVATTRDMLSFLYLTRQTSLLSRKACVIVSVYKFFPSFVTMNISLVRSISSPSQFSKLLYEYVRHT